MSRGTGRTWRPVLGPLAGSELVFRVAIDVNWVRIADLLGRAADSTVVTGLLTVLATSSSALSRAGLFSQLLLYFVFIYAFVPNLFPDEFGDWTVDPAFRLLTTVTVFASYLSLTVEIALSSFADTFGTIVVAGLAYFVFFEIRQSDPFEEPEGALFRILDTAIGTDDEQTDADNDLTSGTDGLTINPDADGVLPLVARVLTALASCSLLAVLAVFLGVLAYVVSLFFPLPELLILGWSGYGAMAGRVSRLPTPKRSGDIETHAYEAITAAFTAPFKGMATVMYLILGFFTSALPFLAFVGVVSALSLSGIRKLLANPARGGPAFVMIFGLLAFGSYGLWYWWRTSRRVPAFLASVTGDDGEASVTRPVWLTGPPVALLVTGSVTGLGGALYLHHHPSLDLWPVWLTVAGGVAYIPSLVLMTVAVRRTRETEPQAPDTEDPNLPIAATIQVVGVVFASFSVVNYEAVKRDGISAYADGLSTMLALVVLGGLGLAIVFYFRDVIQKADEADGLRATALNAGPAFALALLSGGLLVVRGNTSIALVAVAIFVGGGIFLIYLDRRQ